MVQEGPGREVFVEKLKDKMSPRHLRYVLLAYKVAKYGHRGQMRKSGERYFEHPKKVAMVLIEELGVYDYELICAALLHDVIEDTHILDLEDIELIFGDRVRSVVDVLSKPQMEDKALRDLDYWYRIAHADRDSVMVKLADRLNNMRELDGFSPEKVQEWLNETEMVFIPLAKRMGMEVLERELRKVVGEGKFEMRNPKHEINPKLEI